MIVNRIATVCLKDCCWGKGEGTTKVLLRKIFKNVSVDSLFFEKIVRLLLSE